MSCTLCVCVSVSVCVVYIVCVCVCVCVRQFDLPFLEQGFGSSYIMCHVCVKS